MSRYAVVIVKSSVVQNVIEWDGVTPWTPPDGCIAVAVSDTTIVEIGYLYINGEFVPPTNVQ